MMILPSKRLDNGFKLPVLSMGTWMIGGARERDLQCDPETEISSIKKGLELGLSCIDTAEMYAGGFTEELIGRAIRERNRDSLQLISKVSPEHLSCDELLKACNNSLKRLQTDYLDIYLIHLPNPDIPLSQTMRGMKKLLERKIVRHIGVSNFSVNTLCKAQDLLEAPIVLNQVHYNLAFREPEESGLISYCQQNDIFLMAWRPLQKGVLISNPPLILQKLSTRYNRSPGQIAINWLISQANVVTLSTMRREDHIRENLGATGWSLETDDIELLRKEFPGQQGVSDREPLR